MFPCTFSSEFNGESTWKHAVPVYNSGSNALIQRHDRPVVEHTPAKEGGLCALPEQLVAIGILQVQPIIVTKLQVAVH